MHSGEDRIPTLFVAALLVTTALVPMAGMAGTSVSSVEIVTDETGDAVGDGGDASDIVRLDGHTTSSDLIYNVSVVNASDNPLLIQHRVNFEDGSTTYTAKVSYQTDGDLVSAVLDRNGDTVATIGAKRSGDTFSLIIDRFDVGDPAEGDTFTNVFAETRHGDSGDTFDITDSAEYRVGNNAEPVLEDVADKTMDEGQTLEFNVTATDADGDSLDLSAANVPANANFTDAGDPDGDGTFNGTFTFEPDFEQAGNYTVNFTADDGDVSNTISVDITVNDVETAPVIEDIPDKNVDEGATLEFNVTATDPKDDTVNLSASGLPAGATFDDSGETDPDGDGTYNGTFTWSPDFDQAGNYTVEFSATDPNNITVTEEVDITVDDVNGAPAIDAIADQTVEESNVTSFNLTATDPNGDNVTWSVVDAPEGSNFTDLGDEDGDGTFNATFEWNTTTSDAGTYTPTFVASDGVKSNNVTVTINVTEIAAPDIGPGIFEEFVEERDTLTVDIASHTFDPDEDPLTYFNISDLPEGANFSEDGIFTWDTDDGDVGDYVFELAVTDGSLRDTTFLEVHVLEDNSPPELEPINDTSSYEGDQIKIAVSADDPDGDDLSLSVEDKPQGAEFVDNGDGTGTFTWTPREEDVGQHSPTFVANDSDLQDKQDVTITVFGIPNLDPIDDEDVQIGQSIKFDVSATDPDNSPSELELSTIGLPNNATFTDNGDGTGTFEFSPSEDDLGKHDITFVASDGNRSDSQTATITAVAEPRFDPVQDVEIFEREMFRTTFDVDDPDTLDSELEISAENLPDGAEFTDNGDGTATLEWKPSLAQAGTYPVTLTVTDGEHEDTASLTIVVKDEKPELDIRMRDNGVSISERATVLAEVTFPHSPSQAVPGAQINVEAAWTEGGQGRFVQSHDTQTGRFGLAIINLDRDVAGAANVPGQHTVNATAQWEDPATGLVFTDMADETTYTVS